MMYLNVIYLTETAGTADHVFLIWKYNAYKFNLIYLF